MECQKIFTVLNKGRERSEKQRAFCGHSQIISSKERGKNKARKNTAQNGKRIAGDIVSRGQKTRGAERQTGRHV